MEQNRWRSRSARTRLVLLGRLSRLAQHDPPVRLATREVAALAVGRRTPDRLDGERRTRLGEPSRDARVGDGAQVVAVRDECPGEALVEESLEEAGAPQRGVQVAVTRWAPLEVAVARPAHRGQVVRAQLRLTVLQELQRQALDGEVGVPRQCVHGVGGRAEAVHEQQGQRGVVLASQVQHLSGDDVEEGHPLADTEQALGTLHPHRGAQPAVELDHRRRAQRFRRRGVVDLDVVEALAVERLDGVLGDHPGLAVLEQPVVVGEGLDGDGVEARLRHLRPRAVETSTAHAAIVGWASAALAIPTGRPADL